MPRIVISTIDGEVVKIIDHDDIGELSHPIALADIADEIRVAVAQARRTEKQRWSLKDEVRS